MLKKYTNCDINKLYSVVEKLQAMAIYVHIEAIYCQLNLLNRGNIIIEKSQIIEKYK